MVARGELRHFRLGRLIRIPAAALTDFAASLPGGKFPPLKPIARDGLVYFIQGGEKVKIGWAVNPFARLADLQIGSPIELKLLGAAEGGPAGERKFHALFAEYRVHGEWFVISGKLANFINENFPDG